MPLVTLTEAAFEAFASTVKERYFEQSTNMNTLLKKRGYTTELKGFEDKQGKLQVAALIFSTPVAGGIHMEIHYGPLFLDESYLVPFLKELKKDAKANKVIEFVVKPYAHYQVFDDHGNPQTTVDQDHIDLLTHIGFEHTKPKVGYTSYDWHYVKDLTGITEKNLINSFSKKGKPLVKKAKTFGIKVKALTKDELPLFKAVTSSTSDRREYDDKPLEYYEYFYDSFKDKAQFLVATLNFKDYYANLEKDQATLRAKLDKLENDLIKNPKSEKKQNQHREFSSQFQTFEVRKAEAQELITKYGDQDVILAGALFVFTQQEVTYFFSGSYSEFNKFYAPTILQEYVMLEAIKRGIKRYNLLGISGYFDGSDGVLGFKQNFKGHVECTVGTFTYYPNPVKHKLIKSIKKLLKRY
ncbi:aminoacyltransferase [Streptococcus pseudoporcinus]|uniref:Aminoacyltransferase FemA n=1 Tax=Streptococcus pseudoporcinus TaxID=361101 RepID=A0A4U9XLB9_9STRE|nr:aminoacyltransferase [Streptococcus pseudoporcinus]VTS13101.1 peptidoglycan branched peptide synthesis protein [Streptococcus pseudoporcinus]VUC66288.1 peptidoglycan branched peptide synthesis protein [Streptococcus pseudoporcinus]VUC97216.1 peptidoglycan branched peptide synthesis protein [Streptococcus pseudoporcinus]VUC97604.1 peptidoglycan branched peptide synthesis protein [Streptococcus pseudoporcinus]